MRSTKHQARLNHESYTVALICPLEVDLSAARYMLDEEHQRLPGNELDPNSYTLGTLGGHNVVVTALPEGSQGPIAAATVATHLSRSFPAVELRLLVGIAGGVPGGKFDIHLGDVVVSAPTGTLGGVVEYDMGQETVAGFQRKGLLCPPPAQWRSTMTKMKSDHRTQPHRIDEFVREMIQRHPESKEYWRPPPERDVLFAADYEHVGEGAPCAHCDKGKAVSRARRTQPMTSEIFYGLIASGNRVIKSGIRRDILAQEAGGAICFEMEAAGLMNDFQCIVIRGIANYCDSHKNDHWNGYAAAAAAAVAKEMLTYIQPAGTKEVNCPPYGYYADYRWYQWPAETPTGYGTGGLSSRKSCIPATGGMQGRDRSEDWEYSWQPADLLFMVYVEAGVIERPPFSLGLRRFQSEWQDTWMPILYLIGLTGPFLLWIDSSVIAGAIVCDFPACRIGSLHIWCACGKPGRRVPLSNL